MVQNVLIENAWEYICNFEQKNITFAFLITVGRSGSTLLQTLIDNHSEVLMIPTVFKYYFDWEENLVNLANSPEELVKIFLKKSSFSAPWYTEGLGENKNETLDLNLKEVENILLKIIKKFDKITRKNFLLAIHFAYAIAHNIDFKKIKCILQHHHFMMSAKSYKSSSQSLFSENLVNPETYPFFKEIREDFLNPKILNSIRSPFDVFNSCIELRKEGKESYDIYSYYLMFFHLLFAYDTAIKEKVIFQNNYQFIKFEELHTDSTRIMRTVADFLNISYSNSLLTSTVGGKIWWGTNPQKPMNGTNPAMVNEKWKNMLSQYSKVLCATFLNDLAVSLNYEKLLVDKTQKYIKSGESFLNYIQQLFNEKEEIKNLNISMNDFDDKKLRNTDILYPYIEKSLFRFYFNKCIGDLTLDLDLYQELKPDCPFSSVINYQNTKIFIRYTLFPDFYLPDIGYFILLEPWNFSSENEKSINFINRNVDEIWVLSDSVKNEYLESGIDEVRIFTIPFKYDNNQVIEVINTRIEQLSDKLIFRTNFDSIIETLKSEGRVRLSTEKYLEASIIFSRLCKLEPKNPEFFYNYGFSLARLEKFEEAIEPLANSLELGIYNKEILSLLAKCLEKTDDFETAKIYYEKANEL